MPFKTKLMRILFRMMGAPTCQELEQFAYDFLEGKLDEKTTRAVERHLKMCPNCLKFIETYRKAKEAGTQIHPPPLESEFQEKMLEFLLEKRKSF